MQAQSELLYNKNTIQEFIQKYNETISTEFNINLEELNSFYSNFFPINSLIRTVNNLPLNSPMNLSIVNNVLIESKDERHANICKVNNVESKNEQHADICKYTFKKGDKKNEYCGIIVKPGLSLCSKHKKPDTFKPKKITPNQKNEYNVRILKSDTSLVKDNKGYIFKNKNTGSEIKNKHLYLIGISISSDDTVIKYLKDFSEKEKLEADDYVERHGSKIDNCINGV